MAVSVRSSTIGTKSSNGSFSVNKPAGAASGDLLVALHNEDVFGTDAAMTAPAGWTQQGATYSGSGSARGKIWYRVVDGSEGASFSFGQDDTSSLIMLCVTGQDATTPFNVSATWSQGGSAQTDHIAPSITPSANDCLLVCLFASTFNSGVPAYTPASSMTEAQDSGNAAGFVFNSVDYLVLTGGSGSATGTKTATCSITTINEFTTASLAIAPAAAGSSATPQPVVAPQAAVMQAANW